jgi:hypothetical protein
MRQILSRAPDLDVHEVPDGYIIYHGSKDSVSYLNKTAAVVFEFCDANLDVEEVVSRVAKMFSLEYLSHDEIKTCIERLVQEGVVRSNAT